MQDYMRALQDRFDSIPPRDAEMKEEVNQIFKDLCSGMERTKRSQLIRLVDLENSRREMTALNSFISGYRLAWGIHRELTDEPPYSFEDEEEERGRNIFMKEARDG